MSNNLIAEDPINGGEDSEQYLQDGEEFLMDREKRDAGGNEYITKYEDDRKRRAVDDEDYLAEDDEDYRRKREINEENYVNEDTDGYRKKRKAGDEDHLDDDNRRDGSEENYAISEEYRKKRDAGDEGYPNSDDHFDDDNRYERSIGGRDMTVEDNRQRREARCKGGMTLLSKILRGCLQY